MNYQTPIHKLKIGLPNVNLYIKRDDLLPFSFGGNKVRIAEEFYDDMENKGMDCMIGYGNVRSNLCRVLANLAASKSVKCHIINASDDKDDISDSTNKRLVNLCGAIIENCKKCSVAETVNKVIDKCRSQGYKPYYIYGDAYGKGNEATPVRAYVKAYNEILTQEKEMGVVFDYVFCATGTGMTQAGLIVGNAVSKEHKKIIGISVARGKEQELEVLRNYVDSYIRENNIKLNNCTEINVIDDYLFDGYGSNNKDINATISEVFKQNGVVLDPVYTGKAFYGMMDYLRNNVKKSVNVLFIHTGSSPLFFDNMNSLE